MKKDITNPADMRKELDALLEKSRLRERKAKSQGFFKKKQDRDIKVYFRCARNGKAFAVIFEQKSRNAPYHFKAVKPMTLFGSSSQDGQSASRQDIDITKLPLSEWFCPWCRKKGQNAGGFIKCERCENYVCDGRSTRLPNGNRYFRCYEACGSEAEVENRLTTLTVDRQEEERELFGSKPSTNKALPRGKDFISLPKK